MTNKGTKADCSVCPPIVMEKSDVCEASENMHAEMQDKC
jgi:hypothetical protein